MTKQTCPHCGQALPASQIRGIGEAYARKMGSAGGKAGSAKVDTKKRASEAGNARWKKYREAKAKKEEDK